MSATLSTLTTPTGAQRLTSSEAEGLWRNWKERGDSGSRDRLVLAYAPMVRYIASRKVRELPAQCELDDLASSGLVALMEAIDRFDPAKGASFEQYAWTRVAGALVDELASRTGLPARSGAKAGASSRPATPSSPVPARCRPSWSSRTSSARPSMSCG